MDLEIHVILVGDVLAADALVERVHRRTPLVDGPQDLRDGVVAVDLFGPRHQDLSRALGKTSFVHQKSPSINVLAAKLTP